MTRPTLTLLCGLPAAGKSTYAARLRGVVVVTLDTIRTDGRSAVGAVHQAHHGARQALERGQHVVIDACSLRAVARTQARNLARDVGAQIELVFFQTNAAICRARDQARIKSARSFDWPHAAQTLAQAKRDVQREGYARILYV